MQAHSGTRGGTVVRAADPRLGAVLAYLPEAAARALGRLPPSLAQTVEEVRLRAERPLAVGLAAGEPLVTATGQVTQEAERALTVSAREVRDCVERMAGFSVYALEEEFRRGFLTLPGGHRVGLGGRTRLADGRIRTVRPVTSLAVRVARQVPDVALPLAARLTDGRGGLCSTLLVGPPRSGKTTLLRDLARLASRGVPSLGLAGAAVVVVDERSELGGGLDGVPSLDLGPRTDLLDGCPKADGLYMALRSLSPRLLVTDEIGSAADVAALTEAAAAGVRVIATLHGDSLEEAGSRPLLRPLLESGLFSRWVRLGRRPGPGAVLEVRALEGGRPAADGRH